MVRTHELQAHVRGAERAHEPEPRASLLVERDLLGADVCAMATFGDAERQHPRRSTLRHARDERVVGVQHCHPVHRQRLDELGLRDGGLLARAERPDMGETDVEHDAGPRWCDDAQAGDVSDAARAHLQH